MPLGVDNGYGAPRHVDYDEIKEREVVGDVHKDTDGSGETGGTPRNANPAEDGGVASDETEAQTDDNVNRGDSTRNISDVDGDNDYFTVEATAYTNGAESTGKRPGDPAYGVTASGTQTSEGRTAACPPSLALGTEIYVKELDNTYICEDRGGAIVEGKLDIYVEDLDRAIEFGRQDVEVRILR